MLLSSYILLLSNTIKRRQIHKVGILTSLKEKKKENVKKSRNLIKEEFDFSKTSLEPFLSRDKTDLLKKFYGIKSEITSTYNFVINEAVAKDIVENIVRNIEQKNVIIEGNPGLGLITLNLINYGMSRILIFDHSSLWDVSLAQIIAKYPNTLARSSGNFNTNSDLVLLGVMNYSAQYGCSATFVGVTTSFYFIRGLVINFVNYNLWQNKFQAFLVVSPLLLENLGDNTSRQYLKLYVYWLFKALFHVEEIARYPRAAFLPHFKNSSKEDMILIKVSFNSNFHEKINGDELYDYIVLLRILGERNESYIIPVLEKWLPDCGPYLISKGVSMTTRISDLSFEESFLLYNFIKEFEGYKEFIVCVSSIIPKPTNIFFKNYLFIIIVLRRYLRNH